MTRRAAVIASCALLPCALMTAALPFVRYAPRPQDWLLLESQYVNRSGGFLGARVTGRFMTEVGCRADLMPPGYVTVVGRGDGDGGARDSGHSDSGHSETRTFYARRECVRMPRVQKLESNHGRE